MRRTSRHDAEMNLFQVPVWCNIRQRLNFPFHYRWVLWTFHNLLCPLILRLFSPSFTPSSRESFLMLVSIQTRWTNDFENCNHRTDGKEEEIGKMRSSWKTFLTLNALRRLRLGVFHLLSLSIIDWDWKLLLCENYLECLGFCNDRETRGKLSEIERIRWTQLGLRRLDLYYV